MHYCGIASSLLQATPRRLGRYFGPKTFQVDRKHRRASARREHFMVNQAQQNQGT